MDSQGRTASLQCCVTSLQCCVTYSLSCFRGRVGQVFLQCPFHRYWIWYHLHRTISCSYLLLALLPAVCVVSQDWPCSIFSV